MKKSRLIKTYHLMRYTVIYIVLFNYRSVFLNIVDERKLTVLNHCQSVQQATYLLT